MIDRTPVASPFLQTLDQRGAVRIEVTGEGDLPSAFAVTDLAVASIAAAGAAAARMVGTSTGTVPAVRVDRRLASAWFASTVRPIGWTVPPPWDPIAGDYLAADGWVKLHTNAPPHRDAALRVLGLGDGATRADVAAAVVGWTGADLEAAVVGAGGCAAEMRAAGAWRAHPQGRAVALEPVLHRRATGHAPRRRAVSIDPRRPLAGVRVLDLTRVLAGPVATRFLAGLGADVIRIDPLDRDEPGVIPEVTLGKRCYRVDLGAEPGRAVLRELLAAADVLVHGYRPGALDALGFDEATRAAIAPGLVDVSLCAYGWTGPWSQRRGFDSLVQMSSGIAEEGMVRSGGDRPAPLPVQALDHATGYLMAMAAIDGWTDRVVTGRGATAQASLARTAAVLLDGPRGDLGATMDPMGPDDELDAEEATSWGPARRLRPPVEIEGVPMWWERGARALGADTGRPGWRR